MSPKRLSLSFTDPSFRRNTARQLIESQIACCKVAAPYAGRVAKLRAKASETVNAGQPLLEIVNAGGLKAPMHKPSGSIEGYR